MAQPYRQLTFLDRQRIEEGLDRADSFREIARTISRDVSTVSREVKGNGIEKAHRPRRAACRDRNWCKRVGVCGEDCARKGAFCAGCDRIDCRGVCPAYAEQTRCDVLARAPWVCNGCRKNRYGCNRANRFVYSARAADGAARARRSESRRGIDMPRERAEAALARIKEGLGGNLSPYEIATLYADEVGVSPSTIYRWVESGYGRLMNIDLERKVGFRPRSRALPSKITRHSPKRSYQAYLKLPEEAQGSAAEMDCVEGRKLDAQCVLTLYFKCAHLQLALLLARKKDCECVKERLRALRSASDEGLFDALFRCTLTDNGPELCDEDGIGAIFGEDLAREGAPRLYYCDPRQSQQKGSCEKNHTEIRQILKKGLLAFDELNERDLAVAMSHANSNPRAVLCGMTPIQMFKAAYGQAGKDFLDALGIEQIPRDGLMLTPDVLNKERARRGEAPLTFLK